MSDAQLRSRLMEIGAELGLKNPEAIVIAERYGMTFSWDDADSQRQSFDILWTEFHRAHGSGYDQLKPHIQREIASRG